MKIEIEKVPLAIRRRVAQKLESIRGTEMAPGANKAMLGQMVWPIYRPDVDGVAYYEFEVTNLKVTSARDHLEKSSNVGFILASAGNHDIPIPHWSVTVEPPSKALETKAKNGGINKILKLDTLAYVAEDNKGYYLAHVGTMPQRISDMENIDLAKQVGISTTIASPAQTSKDDKKKVELVVKKDGVKVPKLKMIPWDSYEQLKKQFAKTYKGHLKLLAEEASAHWQIENLVEKFGEGIHEGKDIVVPFLSKGKASVSGDGSKYIQLSTTKFNENAIKMLALPSDVKQEINVDLNIAYENGDKEVLSFFIIPKGTPTNQKNNLPY
jgi:hypothetical protein